MNENEGQFIRLPAMLLEMALSDGAKLLYAILADRVSLSEMNGLQDERGVYVFCTNREIRTRLHRSHDKATGKLRELERVGLICRDKRGLGHADRIYVENLKVCEKATPECAENPHSGMRKCRTLECGKVAPIQTDYNQTEIIQTYLSRSYDDPDSIRTEIYDNISFYRLKKETGQPELLEEIADLMVSVCSGTDPFIRIGGRDLDGQAVRERLLSLDGDHILYVMECLEGQTIRNRRAYLLTALYNAPDTIDDYYDNQVRRDLGLNTFDRRLRSANREGARYCRNKQRGRTYKLPAICQGMPLRPPEKKGN
ncbi:MAG: hypothetical protein E7426_06100 [Ruminococcaceae bacterium]|nr:hypothetical protein [Oscillospiraceae bacterium]